MAPRIANSSERANEGTMSEPVELLQFRFSPYSDKAR